MKYRVLDPNLTAVSQGDFSAIVENGEIDLPDELARDFIAIGLIAPEDEEIKEIVNDGLRQSERRQSRTRKQRDD